MYQKTTKTTLELSTKLEFVSHHMKPRLCHALHMDAMRGATPILLREATPALLQGATPALLRGGRKSSDANTKITQHQKDMPV